MSRFNITPPKSSVMTISDTVIKQEETEEERPQEKRRIKRIRTTDSQGLESQSPLRTPEARKPTRREVIDRLDRINEKLEIVLAAKDSLFVSFEGTAATRESVHWPSLPGMHPQPRSFNIEELFMPPTGPERLDAVHPQSETRAADDAKDDWDKWDAICATLPKGLFKVEVDGLEPDD